VIASLRLTFIALAPIALTLSLVAPGSVGCGSRNVGGSTDASAPASSAAAPSTPGDKAAAPAPAPAAAAATARGTPAEPVEAAPPPSTAPTAAELAGDYECRFTRGERELTPVTCTIRSGDGGALAMEQTNGNIRLRGVVAPDEAGFRFTGEVTCASGPCAPAGSREMIFFRQSRTDYAAVLTLKNGNFLNVDLRRKP
jgi:hypothetical protein